MSNADTPTKEITVAGIALAAPAPFTEGHVLKQNEADVLNQTLAENLRNNFASKVKAAKEEAEKAGTEVDTNALQAAFTEYANSYQFGVRTGGGSAGPRLEPRERIALNLAKEKIRELMRAKGKKPSDYAAETITGLAEQLVAQDGQFLAEADRQLKVKRKQAEVELDLDSIPLKPVAEAAAE